MAATIWTTFQPVDADAQSNWSTILWEQSDINGISIPIRQGDARIGYNHFAQRHNLSSGGAVRQAIKVAKPITTGARVEYVTLFTHANDHEQVYLRVIAQAATTTDDREYSSPDGKYIGVVTAYCDSMNKCPYWLSNLQLS
ncbi:hypothetical protein D5S18_32150 [Nocardia panacis]|uniref:Uncharacterized protein n=1 Tax=Nocardia panacis TaxID=2340916 RepID=A0A3A4K4U2_9NOCA|nr:hypothetical protein [Nocardia panacis]RJO69294.1 hypothetical protein D5S18_32150 [Nocardia panacis]